MSLRNKGSDILVKGMTRRVIVIKSPDKRLFEEAVFFLRNDSEHGVSGDEIVAEAQAVADGFLRDSFRIKKLEWLRAPLWALAGAVLASLVWTAAVLLF